MKIIAAIVLAFGLLVAGWYFGNRLFPGGARQSETGAFIFSDLPIAEIATREIKWKVLVHYRQAFPAREYAVCKIATIKAGFDAAGLDPRRDVAVDENVKLVTVRLPEPKILAITWSAPEIVFERHSLLAAALTRSNADEFARGEMFNRALLADLETEELLSFESLTEGLKKMISPLFGERGYRVEYLPSSAVDFSIAVENYLRETGGGI